MTKVFSSSNITTLQGNNATNQNLKIHKIKQKISQISFSNFENEENNETSEKSNINNNDFNNNNNLNLKLRLTGDLFLVVN